MNTTADMVKITCNCKVHNGTSALVSAERAKGMTDVMAHNYVSYLGGPLGRAMGVFPVEG